MELGGLYEAPAELGIEVAGPVSVWPLDSARFESPLQKASLVSRMAKRLRAEVAVTLAAEDLPVVIGGDHTIALGSVSGALEAFGKDLAVLWVDAHMDFHTPASSDSGNLHGMPLAALLRLDEVGASPLAKYWRRWLRDVVPETGLTGERVAWLGLRDVDPGERSNLEQVKGAYVASMQHVDRHGLMPSLEAFLEWYKGSGAKRLWVSFDVDSLDPLAAPGTGTAVRGGLTFREGHLLAETLFEWSKAGEVQLAGCDIVEVNPLCDRNNETARLAVDWLASLLGKRIV